MKRVAIYGLAVFLVFSVLSSCGSGSRSGNLPATLSARGATNELASSLKERVNALDAPAGVDTSTFDMLKNELGKQLIEKGSYKMAARAPQGAGNAVPDLQILSDGLGGFNAVWHYLNQGDYDQNGEVAIADITPIAIHFLHAAPTGFWPDAFDNAIDGDHSLEIGVGDITPLALNYQTTFSRYSVETSANAGGPYTEIATAPLNGAAGDWKLFTVPLPGTALNFIRVVPHDTQDAAGASSNVATLNDTAPWVDSVSPLTGTAGDVVNFSISGGGTLPITYAWDFGGGAIPNTSTDTAPIVTLGAAGVYSTCSVTVTNGVGFATFPFTLTVSPAAVGPNITLVDPTVALAGSQISFTATVTGDPPLTYSWDFGGGATPNTSSSVSPLETIGAIGQYSCSLTVTNAGGQDVYPFNLDVSNVDTNPPVWDSTVGITGLTPVANSNKLTVTFGRATDNSGADVNYIIWFAKTADWNIGNLPGMASVGIWWITLSDPAPYQFDLIGLDPGVSYTALVRAQDRAIPTPNDDTNTNTLTATVDANGLLISAITATPNIATKGEVVDLSATVSGGDGVYAAVWSDDSTGGGFFFDPKVAGANITSQWGAALAEPTWYDITVDVTDGSGHSGSQLLYGLEVDAAQSLSFATDVYPIIQNNCAPCHVGGSSGGLNMSTAPTAYSNLVNVNSGGVPTMKRVKAFEPEISYLLHKLQNRAPISGGQMPPGGPLSDANIKTITQWIFGGALP